ncbi:Ig-like domain-containing protein [Ruminococcaceae bacterium OttesenSCG-928-L11]|nr:Ig-like domain-containing protein [Ruminococcaceae bacterium OttesenSCG-928-L11]
MSEFFKNKRTTMLSLSAFFLAVTLLAGSFAYLFEGADIVDRDAAGSSSSSQPASEESDAPNSEEEPEDSEPEPPVEPETEEVDDTPVHYNKPGEMRGVYLVPGTDFIATQDTSEATIRAEIDKAVAEAKRLTMNTVIIDTVYADKVIYQTSDSPLLTREFDIMEYLVEKCREAGLYTYAIFDVSFYGRSGTTAMLAVGAGTINTLSVNLREFADKYQVDGILIDGYINKQTPESYSMYTVIGAAMGYDNFMRQTPRAVIESCNRTLRKYARGTQIGLLADAVWDNSADNEEGSATTATFTALRDGNADTKAFLTDGLVDFVAVKAFGSTTDAATPFGEVVSWWTGVAKEAGVPMYAVHAADKICTDAAGWSSQDQIVRQVIAANEISGFGGSIFNNLKRLSDDPKSATTTLIKYYNEEIVTEHILTELQVTKPEKTSYTTNEPVVTFTGASDPNFPITINGEAVATDASGYFTVTLELKGGENTFTISHKDKSVHYQIVREIEILKDITPQGSIAAEGNMSISISALAYEDAAVYAVINGTTVAMTVDDGAEDESSRDSSYKRFVGQYETPAATGEEQSLGNIVVYATWKDQEKSIQGASVRVNKKAKIEDGVPVVVVKDQARTYPANTLNNIPNANYYPLPKGAMDYAVGDEIVYKSGSSTYTYYVLASQLRIESGDISASNDYASGNVVNGMTVHTEGGYTYVTLKTAQKVSYSFRYGASGVDITFHNTTKVPGSAKVDSNAIFKDATWSDSTLSLAFVKSGGFMGYKAYYGDNGDLVFRFNNPPNSINGARITIDPGHGGKDYGALGFLAKYPEKVLNLAIAQLLADELTSRGAKVQLLDTSGGMSLDARVQAAESYNSDLFVSVHNNTAPSSSASGTEVFYFYPFAKTLASGASSNVSSQLSTANRGAKQSYYVVTLSSQMPSVLVECGFMSNKAEYEKLIKEKYQERVAVGIADAIASSIKAAATGYTESTSSGGASEVDEEPDDERDREDPKDTSSSSEAEAPPESQAGDNSSGGSDAPPEPESSGSSSESSGTTGTAALEELYMVTDDSIQLEEGDTKLLKVGYHPTNVANKKVTWKSGNTSVATVDANGRVTAIAEGKVKITATAEDGGKTATCDIEVVGEGSLAYSGNNTGDDDDDLYEPGSGADNAKVTGMELSERAVTLKSGATQRLTVKATPSSASDLRLTWWSSDEAIAKVDSNGKITAVGAGVCNVIATLYGTDIEEGCTVTVNTDDGNSSGSVSLKNIDEIYFEESLYTMYIGAKQTLVLDSDKGRVDNSQLKWESSNTAVATVSSSGTVTAKRKTGTAKIIAYTEDDEFYASCTVSVTDKKVSVTGVSLNSDYIYVEKGGKYTELKATINPSNATNKDLTWSTGNKRIATVDAGGVVTGVNRGETTITVTSSDGKFKATCTVEVVKELEVDYIEFDYGDELWLYVDDEDKLEVLFYPEGISSAQLVWSSSRSSVVSVDGSGNIKALKRGTATIRAALKSDPDIYAECEITVE